MKTEELHELIDVMDAISKSTGRLAEILGDVVEEIAPLKTAVPTKTYSYEEVRGILAEKARNGHRTAVKELIGKYGGKQLSDYKDRPDVLSALVKDAEVMDDA